MLFQRVVFGFVLIAYQSFVNNIRKNTCFTAIIFANFSLLLLSDLHMPQNPLLSSQMPQSFLTVA